MMTTRQRPTSKNNLAKVAKPFLGVESAGRGVERRVGNGE